MLTLGNSSQLDCSRLIANFTIHFERSETTNTNTDTDNSIDVVGKDVAAVLGYKNTCKALTDHVETEDKVVTFCYSLGGKQKTTFINESGLYSLILSSKLPKARELTRRKRSK